MRRSRPPSLAYQPEFLSRAEEQELIALVQTLPFHAANYKDYFAWRRVVSFGGSFDFDTHELRPARELDVRLLPLRNRVAAWRGIRPETLVSEYARGTSLGWHRDVPNFVKIFGISLGGEATLKFRPFPTPPTCSVRWWIRQCSYARST